MDWVLVARVLVLEVAVFVLMLMLIHSFAFATVVVEENTIVPKKKKMMMTTSLSVAVTAADACASRVHIRTPCRRGPPFWPFPFLPACCCMYGSLHVCLVACLMLMMPPMICINRKEIRNKWSSGNEYFFLDSTKRGFVVDSIVRFRGTHQSQRKMARARLPRVQAVVRNRFENQPITV